jgi:hypothetical protein
MPARCSFDYAVVRVVPRVERGEFVNAGVILYCTERRYLGARFELDERRLAALFPAADPAEVARHLESIARVCAGGDAAGPIGRLPQRARFDWLVAPRSTIVQTSPVHSGLAADLERTIEHLMDRMVRVEEASQQPR